jgi:hypothetical protein
MHNQLNHIIAKQRHAELIQTAEHARLIAAANPRRPEQQPIAALKSFRGRIIAAVVHVAPRATHDA